MKIIIKTVSLTLLLASAGICLAVEPITGAFGIKLGDVLDSASLQKRNVMPTGEVKYEVTAVSPHKSFQTYEVEITSDAKKIHTIIAAGRYPGQDAALKVFSVVKTELESKYGPAKTNRREGAAFFASGDKSISLTVNQVRSSVAYLTLTCKEDGLVKLAEKVDIPKPAAPAADTIDGAFGYKFGEVFDTSKAIGTGKTTQGEPLYMVKAKVPNPSFNRYFVQITPKTKKIFQVWAQGPFSNEQAGRTRRDALANAIAEKYQTKKGFWDGNIARVMEQGDAVVTIKTIYQPGGSVLLEIRYNQTTLEKEGRNEAAGIDMKKAGSSNGL